MADKGLSKAAVVQLYPVTLDPAKPIIALGMPKEIFELILQSRAELVQAVFNCGLVVDRTDHETGKKFVLFKRNLTENESAEEYLDEALEIANMFFERIATLMSEQEVSDTPQKDNYWRLIIDLKKEWREGLEGIEGASDRADGKRIGDARIQWNEGKGVIRVKTMTLTELKQQTNDAISCILDHLGSVLDGIAQDGYDA